MERKLREREEREQQLMEAKAKLENDIAEIMKSSGDSSAQLTKMNDELRLKERYFHHCQSTVTSNLHSHTPSFSFSFSVNI